MNYHKDQLLEFESNAPEKSKYFTVIICLSALFILFVLTDFVFDWENSFRITNHMDWGAAFVLLLLPVTGLGLFLKAFKFGWAICLFYYLFMTLTEVVYYLRDLLQNGYEISHPIAAWRAYVLFSISVSLLFLLISKDIRHFLRISISHFRNALLISSAISLIILAGVLAVG